MNIQSLKVIAISFAIIILTVFAFNASADTRFNSKHSCSNSTKTCTSSGTREVDGYMVHRDCWDFAYTKTCNYPSKNNCRLYAHCYAAGNDNCLLQDSLGNCVNMQREFSCKSWDVVNLENQKVRTGFKEKDGREGLVCKGMPCLDGNCVDKSYETNGKMMDSLSKLYATSEMKSDKKGKVDMFKGDDWHCAKKPVGYSNCCRIGKVGWGKKLKAKCTKDENTLMDMRSKNLCVYVGAQKKKKAGIHVLTKHRYCCFGDILNKVIQVGGRKQLGMSFGSGSSPDCRGFTLEEINKINWDKVDFAEFIEDLKVKFGGGYKAPSADDLKATIEGSLSSIDGFDSNLSVAGSVDSKNFDPNNPSNRGGFSGAIKDDSWETLKEKRLEDAKKERVRLARLEAERLEKTRLAEIERQRLVRIENLRQQELQRKMNAKKQEIVVARALSKRLETNFMNYYTSHGGVYDGYSDRRYRHLPWFPEYNRQYLVWRDNSDNLYALEKELKKLEALK
jgi:conjugal transfer mating pair stabilization protein TraN